MSLVTLREVLVDAQKYNYAVGAFNAINLDMARGIIKAAEEEKSPVIISLAEVHFNMAPLELVGPILVDMAKKARIPVVIHLDHGVKFDTVIKAMHMGFTSIMYDGSSLPFEVNMKNSMEIVKVAKSLDVSVEGEVGRLVTPETGGHEEVTQVSNPKDFYTNPMQAQEFVEKTEVDALAVAYGTAHGLYTFEPELDFELLREIRDITGIPLVMHGGSGLSEENYKKSIACGICKINYYSDMAHYVAEKVKEKLLSQNDSVYIHDISQWTIKYVADVVSEKMRVFGSNNRYNRIHE